MGIVLLTLVILGFGADSYNHYKSEKNISSTDTLEVLLNKSNSPSNSEKSETQMSLDSAIHSNNESIKPLIN